MATESLESFLRQKQEKNDGDGIDWQARLGLWKFKVDELYNQIEKWLQALIADGVLTIEPDSLELTEDYLGTYDIASIHLKVGSERIYLRPRGTLIVGGFGRVDMIGDDGRVMIVLLGPEETKDVPKRMKIAQWNLVDRDKIRSITPLTEESFSDAVKLVMRK